MITEYSNRLRTTTVHDSNPILRLLLGLLGSCSFLSKGFRLQFYGAGGRRFELLHFCYFEAVQYCHHSALHFSQWCSESFAFSYALFSVMLHVVLNYKVDVYSQCCSPLCHGANSHCIIIIDSMSQDIYCNICYVPVVFQPY